jgi:hypothetical protein
MKQRASARTEHVTQTTGSDTPDDGALRRAQGGSEASIGGVGTSPIIILSYPHSGAGRVQDLLAAETDLACTAGTGVVQLCAAAAETWRRIEGHHERAMSQLAVAAVRQLVTTQVTVILAGAGKVRWCELAAADSIAAQSFHEVFPHAVFVCVHRCCPDVIRARVEANPWGLHGQGLGPYLLSYPGNSAAALAAYWANSAEELLAFENANPEITHRVLYEDMTPGPGGALDGLRMQLGLSNTRRSTVPSQVDFKEPNAEAAHATGSEVPVKMIPVPLRERVNRLHAALGYPLLSELSED